MGNHGEIGTWRTRAELEAGLPTHYLAPPWVDTLEEHYVTATEPSETPLFNLMEAAVKEATGARVEREIFPAMAGDQQLYAMRLPGYWMDIGQPHDYLSGQTLYLKSLAESDEMKGQLATGPNTFPFKGSSIEVLKENIDKKQLNFDENFKGSDNFKDFLTQCL